jgi:pimeloyl-ACP methyl ester carboxylesterase
MRIVLVHGAFGGAWCWEPVLPGLRAAGHTVEAIDLPGHGEDKTPVAEVTLDAYADRVCGVLAAGPPAVLVGHSMGGVVVTQAAARNKQLEAFTKVSLKPRASGRVTLALGLRSFAHWSTSAHRWQVTPGCYRILVGSSSR